MNITVRENVPVKIRDAFEASPGYVWVSCDYSQLEYRTMTNLAMDEHLVKMFEDGVDFHTATASMMLGIPVDQVDKKSRKLGKCVTGDTLIYSPSHGLIRIDEVSDFREEDQFIPLEGFDVINMDGEICKADSFYYGGIRKVTNIITRYGFKIGGSTDKHKIIVLDDNGFPVYKKMADLTLDDKVVLYLGGFEKETDAYVKFPMKPEWFYQFSQDHPAESEKDRLILDALKEVGGYRKDAADLLGMSESAVSYVGRKYKVPACLKTRPEKFLLHDVTEEVAELWGMVLADGHLKIDLRNTHHGSAFMTFGSADRENIDRFIYLCKKLWPEYTPSVHYRPTNTGVDFWNVFVSSLLVVQQFSCLGKFVDRKSANLFIPKEIMRSKTSVKAAFLAGWFNGDGCFTEKEANTCSISKQFIYDMQALFGSMGMLAKVWSETPSTMKGTDYLAWKLALVDDQSHFKFYDLVADLLIVRKRDKFKSCIERFKQNSSCLQVAYNLKEAVQQSMPGLTLEQRKGKYRYINKGINSYGYACLQEVCGSASLSNEYKSLINNYLDRKIIAVPIKEIYETEEPVYDFHVPDGHQFIGNSFLNSNTLNFGISFGMTPSGLARALGCSKQEAEEKQAQYFKNIPKIRDLIAVTKATTRTRGYSRTFFGRMRHFKKQLENAAGNQYKEDNALMTSFNSTVQGCLPGDAYVYTEDGIKPLEGLLNKSFNVWDGNRFMPATVLYSGKKRLCKTTFNGHNVLMSSPDHKILTCTTDSSILQWKSVKDLHVGDLVALDQSGVAGGKTFPEDLAELLGRFCGDGEWGNGSPFISFHYSKELEDLEYYKGVAEKYGFNPVVRIKKRKPDDCRHDLPILVFHSPFQDLLRDLNITFKDYESREISSEIFAWNIDARRAFIRGLMSADGGFSSYISKQHDLKFTKANPVLIKSFCRLLRTCGISSFITVIENNTKGAFRLTITPINKYMDEIGFRQGYKNNVKVKHNISNFVPVSILKPLKEQIYTNYKGQLNHLLTHSECVMLSRCSMGTHTLRSILDKLDMMTSDLSDLLNYKWIKFESFEDLGVDVDMFDLSVDSDFHGYVADGYITHNSGADFAKIALGRCYQALKPYGERVRMLTQVHDEINFEVKCVNDDGSIDSAFLEEVLRKIDYAMSFRKVFPGWADIPADIEIGWNYGKLMGPEEIKQEFGVDVLAIQAGQPPTDVPRWLFENLDYDQLGKIKPLPSNTGNGYNKKQGSGASGSKSGGSSNAGGENTASQSEGPSVGQKMAKDIERRMQAGAEGAPPADLTQAVFPITTVVIKIKPDVDNQEAFNLFKQHVADHFGPCDVVVVDGGMLYRLPAEFRVSEDVGDLEKCFVVKVFKTKPTIKLDL